MGPSPAPPAGNPALLHRFLGIGLVITGIVLIAVRQFAAVAESQDDQVLFDYVFSAIGVTMVGTALLQSEASGAGAADRADDGTLLGR